MNSRVLQKIPTWHALQSWPGYGVVVLAVLLGVLLAKLPLQAAVLIIAATAVVLLTIIQPLFGLTLALLAGPFGALEQLLSGSGSLDSGQLLLFLTLAAWIGRGLARRRIILPHTFLNIPFLLLISVGLLSLIGARSVELGMRELFKWVEMWAIVLLVVDLGSEGASESSGEARYSILGGPPRTLWVVGMLLLAGISQALIGIWQFALRGDGPEHFLVLDRFYRAYGTFEQPNPFGGYMNLSALLAIGVLVGVLGALWGWVKEERRPTVDDGRSSLAGASTSSAISGRPPSVVGRSLSDSALTSSVVNGRPPSVVGRPLYASASTSSAVRGRPSSTVGRHSSITTLLVVTTLVLFAAGVTSLALVLSWSRGAWLGFVAGLAAMVFFWPRKRIYGVLFLGMGLVVFAVGIGSGRMPTAVTARLTGFADDFRLGDVRGVDINDENYSVLERQAHWQAGLDMLNDDILLGVGFGNYAAAYPDYALINWPDPLGHAHNYYINLLAEMGVLGLTAYLLFWLAVMWQSIRLLRRLDWPGRGIVLGLVGVWVALAAHHLVDKLYVNNIYIHLGVLFGLLQLMDLERGNNRRWPLHRSHRRLVEGKE